MFVIDANIFAKIFIEEQDSPKAKKFIEYTIREEIKLYAPKLFVYEIIQIALYYNYDVKDILKILDDYQAFNLFIVDMSTSNWLKASEIAKEGYIKSGFPSLYDSTYHSLAMDKNAVFITADKRHFNKTKHLGHIITLEQWKK